MKASARQIIVKSAYGITPHQEDAHTRWTPELVKRAIAEAFRVLHDTTGRVGHRRIKAAWPEVYREWGDLLAAAEIGYRAPVKFRRRREAHEITRMEMVLTGWKGEDGRAHRAWLDGPLMLDGYRGRRAALVLWVLADLYGWRISDLCRKRRIPRRSFDRHATQAAAMIADRLNRIGLEVW